MYRGPTSPLGGWLSRFSPTFVALWVASACSPTRPTVIGIEASGPSNMDLTGPSVTLRQKSSQIDPTAADSVEFDLQFSEPIDPASLTSADVEQLGEAAIGSWSLTHVSDQSLYSLVANDVRGAGRVIPRIRSGRVLDPSGNSNPLPSTSIDVPSSEVTHTEETETVSFVTQESIISESTSVQDGLSVTLVMSAAKAYDVTIGLVLSSEHSNAVSDTGLSTSSTYTVVIPAGTTSASFSYSLYSDADPDPGPPKVLQFVLNGTDSPGARIGTVRTHRVLVFDDDASPETVSQIAAGGAHTCVITSTQRVFCWGDNSYGQLGDGTTTSRSSPVEIDPGVAYDRITAGQFHTCGFTTVGDHLKCWGRNHQGQLGDGSLLDRLSPTLIASGTDYAQGLAAGAAHTCAIAVPGVLHCWGDNASGQLGLGDYTDRLTPTPVSPGYGPQMISVTLGGSHTCIRHMRILPTTVNYVSCTGNNASGQLGNNTTTARNTFSQVNTVALPASSVAAISAGDSHTCALTLTGSVRCWGSNILGQIGDGTTTQRLVPTATAPTPGTVYTALSVGGSGSCARVQVSERLDCWGKIGGILSPSPSEVGTALSGGALGGTTIYTHGCYVDPNDLILRCFGANHMGQLGDGTVAQALSPLAISPSTTYSRISLSKALELMDSTSMSGSFAAISSSGGLESWGDNVLNQLGDASQEHRTAPLATDPGFENIDVAQGPRHGCAVRSSGTLRCWGDNTYGQLGNGSSVSSLNAVVPETPGTYAKVAVGPAHTCALTTGGALRCWGSNASGALGDGSGLDRNTPAEVDSGTVYSQVSAGGTPDLLDLSSHSCGITSGGALKCWGGNAYSQLGDGTTVDRLSPVTIESGQAYSRVSAGIRSTCAITAAGALKCWGDNSFGQLGDGSVTPQTTPAVVDAGTRYVEISMAEEHTCGITDLNRLKCWGHNSYGQIGDGTTTARLSPVLIDGSTQYQWVSAGAQNTCAITVAGALKCWGINAMGALGTGSFSSWNTPVPIW